MNEIEFSKILSTTNVNITKFIKNDISKMNINGKLYIYDAVGSILFKDKWETSFKMFDTSSKKMDKDFLQVLHFTNLYNKEEKTDIINIMFQTVLNLLVNDPNSKTL